MPLISIITTTYKHEKFIAETIDSILNQSFTNWELLIGDDSPDDLTWNIIQEYTIKYPDKIKAWHHSPNKGIVNNMNFLIEQMSRDSQFIAFLEGDDCYTSDNLEKKLEIFEKYPEVMLVYSQVTRIDAQGNSLGLLSEQLPVAFCQIRDPYDFLRNPANIFSYSNACLRRKVLETCMIRSLGVESSRSSVSDWDFYFQCVTQFSVFGLSDPLLLYRTHGANLSFRSVQIGADFLRLIREYMDIGIYSRFQCLCLSLSFFSGWSAMMRIRIWLILLLPISWGVWIFSMIYSVRLRSHS